MTSARAPAGRVNRNRGKLTATWTKDTVIGLASRLVISQPDAVSNIAVPTFDRTLAVQITVNVTELNAPQREGAGWAEPVDVVRSALKFVSSGVPSSFDGLRSTFASERQGTEPAEPRMGLDRNLSQRRHAMTAIYAADGRCDVNRPFQIATVHDAVRANRSVARG